LRALHLALNAGVDVAVDVEFFELDFEDIANAIEALEWVYGLEDRAAYIRKMGERRGELQADRQMCAPVNYGF